MKEITREVETIVKKPTTIYVANDGTEFQSKYNCEQYEFTCAKSAMEKRKDVLVEHVGCPCNGDPYYSDDYEYIWVKPLTNEARDIVFDTFVSNWVRNDDVVTGKWTCYEINYDNESSAYSIADIMKEIRSQFDALGYDVEFKERRA